MCLLNFVELISYSLLRISCSTPSLLSKIMETKPFQAVKKYVIVKVKNMCIGVLVGAEEFQVVLQYFTRRMSISWKSDKNHTCGGSTWMFFVFITDTVAVLCWCHHYKVSPSPFSYAVTEKVASSANKIAIKRYYAVV